jgi:hypothetical protein
MDMDKYHLALGKFVNEYAHVEADLFLLLILTAGVPIPTGQALFSGTRVSAAISFIKRLYEARNEQPSKRMHDVFAQLNTITTVRDHILHMGVYELDDDTFVSKNWMRAHAERSRKAIDASPEALDAMTADLHTIGMWLGLQQVVAGKPGSIHGEELAEQLKMRSPSPWRYRPVEIRPQEQSLSTAETGLGALAPSRA